MAGQVELSGPAAFVTFQGSRDAEMALRLRLEPEGRKQQQSQVISHESSIAGDSSKGAKPVATVMRRSWDHWNLCVGQPNLFL